MLTNGLNTDCRYERLRYMMRVKNLFSMFQGMAVRGISAHDWFVVSWGCEELRKRTVSFAKARDASGFELYLSQIIAQAENEHNFTPIQQKDILADK